MLPPKPDWSRGLGKISKNLGKKISLKIRDSVQHSHFSIPSWQENEICIRKSALAKAASEAAVFLGLVFFSRPPSSNAAQKLKLCVGF